MKTVHVYNPAAGGGIKEALPENHYLTKSVGDCSRYVAACCKEDPHAHFIVHGGDGTINEAVAGVLTAGAGETARLTFVPAGSGNDTVRALAAMEGDDFSLDAYLCNGRYGVNMVNIGFDCNVVSSAGRFKKKHGVAGSLSYLLGIVTEFFKPFGWRFTVRATEAEGGTFEFEDDALLCAVCNGQWCGGGFHNSPLSSMSDGVLELLLVKKVSRLKFITLIGKYKKGTLIDPATGNVYERYAHLVTYKRITAITVSGTKRVCIDGEVIEAESATVEILPSALCYQANGAAKETV